MEDHKKGLSILHSAFCLGALLIILLLHFFVRPIDLGNISSKIGNLVMSNFILKKKVAAIGTDQITSENIGDYNAAYVLRWALLEGAILVNVLFYFFVEPHSIMIVIALLLLLLLFVSKPKFQ